MRSQLAELTGLSHTEISADSELIHPEGDSLDAVEFAMRLEQEFDILIEEKDAEQVRTVGDAIRYIIRERHRRE